MLRVDLDVIDDRNDLSSFVASALQSEPSRRFRKREREGAYNQRQDTGCHALCELNLSL